MCAVAVPVRGRGSPDGEDGVPERFGYEGILREAGEGLVRGGGAGVDQEEDAEGSENYGGRGGADC